MTTISGNARCSASPRSGPTPGTSTAHCARWCASSRISTSPKWGRTKSRSYTADPYTYSYTYTLTYTYTYQFTFAFAYAKLFRERERERERVRERVPQI